jgi:hypothetical protein
MLYRDILYLLLTDYQYHSNKICFPLKQYFICTQDLHLEHIWLRGKPLSDGEYQKLNP